MKPNSCLSLIALSLTLTATGLSQTASDKPATPAPPVDSRFQIPETDDGVAGAGPIRRYVWFR